MLFFHPDIEYKKYKNDLESLDKIPDDKIIEVGISLDKSYRISEIADLDFDMRNINTKWIWLDTYDEESMDEYKQEVKEYEPEACGIGESDVRGIEYIKNNGNIYSGITSFNGNYNSWMESLEESNINENKVLYNRLVKDGKELSKDAEILGFVVEGTKEELKVLLNKEYIKATSFGIIVDPLY